MARNKFSLARVCAYIRTRRYHIHTWIGGRTVGRYCNINGHFHRVRKKGG
jgi:hypothetical protein